MTNWSETYRGTVPPWECDVTEHFTIAYYFDRLEEGERNLAAILVLTFTAVSGLVSPRARRPKRNRHEQQESPMRDGPRLVETLTG